MGVGYSSSANAPATMAGSQLSQLKSTLKDSGLSRTSSPKDARKRKAQKKQLSSTSQGHRTAKLEAIGKDFNKFDVREENKKFQVVTRQGKLEEGKKGAPGKSRQAGLEQVRPPRSSQGGPQLTIALSQLCSGRRSCCPSLKRATTPPPSSTTASAKTPRLSPPRRRLWNASPPSARLDLEARRRRASTSRTAMETTEESSRTAGASWGSETRRSWMLEGGEDWETRLRTELLARTGSRC